MSEDKYDNYTDDDFLADLNTYADQRDAEQVEDNAELKQHLGEMVGGFLGVWWYLRAFGAASSRNIRTYAAVADKQAKLTAWETADDQMNQDHPHYQSKVTIMNEFGACSRCLPYLGNDYTLAEAKSLVPFHYNCRCTIVRDTSDFDSVIAGVTLGTATELARYQGKLGKPIDDNDISELKNYFSIDDNDIVLLRGTDVDNRLDKLNAVGSSVGSDIIFMHSMADRATLAEELIHYKQFKAGKMRSPDDTNKNEIEAKQYLIDHADVLKLSQVEIEEALAQLQNYL